MNTVQLECFLAAAEYLNFSKAAEEINITQPAVSHQINSLEDELGVKLFVRTSKSVHLTPEGAQFINDAQSMMKIAHDAKMRLINSVNDKRVKFGIGCHDAYELKIVQKVLAFCKDSLPNIYPELRIIPFKSINNLLYDNTIQVLFSIKSEDGKKDASFHELCKCPIVCVTSKDSPLALYKTLNAEKLKNTPAILNEKAKSHETMFKYQGMIASMHRSNDLFFCDGIESCLCLAQAGFGFTVAPLLPINYNDDAVRVPLEDVLPVSFGIYCSPSSQEPVLKKFVKTAQNCFSN